MSNQEYRARITARNVEHAKTIHAQQMMTNERIRARRAAIESVQDRGRISFMGRVKAALMNNFSRRRESHGSEGSGPWGKTLHKASHIQTRHTSGPRGGRRHTSQRGQR